MILLPVTIAAVLILVALEALDRHLHRPGGYWQRRR